MNENPINIEMTALDLKKIKLTHNKDEIDLDAVHRFLKDAYWSKNISIDVVKKAIENSFSVGLLFEDKLIGFGRAITDYATFAYLADIYVEAAFRGQGYSKLIVGSILEHIDSQHLRRILLATRDAHGLYRQFGFTELAQPDHFLEKNKNNMDQKTSCESSSNN